MHDRPLAKSKTPEVRAALARLGWNMKDLAAMMRVPADQLRNLISGNNKSERKRHRIERLLDSPIWHSAQEFARRAAVIDFFGEADPYVMSRQKLIDFARVHLLRAGHPARVRPVSKCLRILEGIALEACSAADSTPGGAHAP